MKNRFTLRVMGLVLTLCMLFTMLPLSPAVIEAEAVSGINSLTCASYISNSTARSYIDTMMRYYLNSSSTLQSTLNNGKSVVFMFEGGSDNYWNGSDYTASAYDIRDQAAVFVVKMNSSGNAYIAFCSEMCSSIPSEPTWCTNGVAYSGATTILDGTYPFYTWNHTGPYAAFQVNMSATNGYAYYTPSNNLNGYKAGASGINIHTRSTNIAAGSALGWVWSEGCQVIGTGGDSSNEFNGFVKAVTGITWNPWISWSSKILNTWGTTGTSMGYYVLDRQLALSNISGTQYGSGSLRALYNTTALTNITATSTAARNAAGATVTDYMSKCTFYPTYGVIKVTGIDVWGRTYPCYSSVYSSSAAISVYDAGDTLVTTGMYKNSEGEYWYQFKNSGGTTLYLNGAYAEFIDSYNSDVTLSGHTKPNGHVKGTGFVVDGTIKTTYNQLSAVSAYVYSGFGKTGASVTGHRATSSGNSYSLGGSTVDNNVLMGILDNGNYTMVISAEYTYYHANGGTLNTLTGKMDLAEDYFMVIPSSASQSSCSHTYKTYFTSASSCTESGYSIKACTTCGLVGEKTATTGSHSYGDWTTVDVTCTTDGIKSRTCSVCGYVEKQVTEATGHKYVSEYIKGNCIEYDKMKYTCSVCSDTYSVSMEQYNQWSENKPEGIDDSLIESKTQYRYSDYETTTSSEPKLEGYTALSSKWVKSSSGNVKYVKSWPSGFSTSSSIYSTYNKTPLSASENRYTKVTIDSDSVTGYLYYHWCYSGSYYSMANSSGNYNVFHAYYSTTAPSNYECDTSDMSYCTAHSTCSNSDWFFVTNVNQQNYTNYTAEYTHAKWGDFSQWSDTEAVASDTRKVETRTVYRCKNAAQLGAHKYVNGICTVCGKSEPDYYLFGFINGADYGQGTDASNIGQYKFVDGKLSVKFSSDSYVAIKTGDNLEHYMTDGYLGEDVTSAILYNSNGSIDADKLFVPGGCAVTFILRYNGDGTYTLSYTRGDCEHDSHDQNGSCTFCGEMVSHTYENGQCTVCGAAEPVYYLYGFLNGADYDGTDYRFTEGKLTVTFDDTSYVAVMQGAGGTRYVADGYPGDDATSATLYKESEVQDSAKMRIPKGREVTFTLVLNDDGTLSLSFVAAECEHANHTTDGICTKCGEEVGHRNIDGVCTICGCNCDHVWGEDDICTKCGMNKPVYFLYGFINGADYDAKDYEFVDGKLTATFTSATYVAVKTGDNAYRYMTEGYQGEEATSATLYSTRVLGDKADKLYIPVGREITFTLTENGDGTLTLSFTAQECEHESHNLNGYCNTCAQYVGHNLVDGVCDGCGRNCHHNYVDGVCSQCGTKEPVFYLVGALGGADYYGEEYKFTGNKLTISFDNPSYVFVRTSDNIDYMTDGYLGEGLASVTLYNSAELGDKADKFHIPGGRTITFTLTDNGDNTYSLSYTAGECKHPYHNTDAVCTYCSQAVSHTYSGGVCTICGYQCKHVYKNDKCKFCGEAEPDYYLFGFINGVDYGSVDNSENIGIYRFSNGKLMAVFTDNCYVGVKTGDNQKWYMADGYPGDEATSAVLYDVTVTEVVAEKLFVPKGRLITFSLENNGDGTLTLSYTAAPCSHTNHDQSGICYTCGKEVTHTYINGMCSICGVSCEHSFTSGECGICGEKCEHNYIDGTCMTCGDVCHHSFSNGVCTVCEFKCDHTYKNSVCTVCGTQCGHKWLDRVCTECSAICTHNFSSGKCTVCGTRCDHLFEAGICAICNLKCSHKWYSGECSICNAQCDHTWTQGKCDTCNTLCEHIWEDDTCTVCSSVCHHQYSGGICNNCYVQCNHNYVSGECTICKVRCIHNYSGTSCELCGYECGFYLVGDINGTAVGYDADYSNTGRFAFTDGKLTMEIVLDSFVFVKTADNKNWYMVNTIGVGGVATLNNTSNGQACDKLLLPAGTIVTLTLTPGDNDTLTLGYTIDSCAHNTHKSNGICTACGEGGQHRYVDDVCTGCGGAVAYYTLFGDINGKAYGYDSNSMNADKYKFTDGTLSVQFTSDSYVAVKLSDNSAWFMAGSDTISGAASAILYNTSTGNAGSKLFVPGGAKVTFTLTKNSDGTLTLSYTLTETPVIKSKYTALSDTDGLRYEVGFSVEGGESVSASDMGLVIFADKNTDGTLAEADEIISGAVADGNNFIVSTNQIHPMKMGDTVYFKVYVKLSDGSYVYSDIMSFSAKRYAISVISSKNAPEAQKAKMVSMLNFGAEMQKYFGYKTDSLVNAGLSSKQQALAASYNPDMVTASAAVDSNKSGEFINNTRGDIVYPTVDISGNLMTLSLNLVTNNTPDSAVTMYYWNEQAFASAQVLTADNATGSVVMTKGAKGIYTATLDGVAMNDIDDILYVSAVYTDGGTTCCSGVISYSIAQYMSSHADKSESDIHTLGKAAVVYSYYLNKTFAS